MNYVGKLLSNFKGFYNEINSATLTGAIDVIIIKQEDGSYVSSPFHVRFGKMGVLRSREKCVDIEINGEPIEDLHMKLGEAGEAFFVHEAQGEAELPAHLATSPIMDDAAALMEEGLSRLHRHMRADDSAIGLADDDIHVTYSSSRMRQSSSQTDNFLCDVTHSAEHSPIPTPPHSLSQSPVKASQSFLVNRGSQASITKSDSNSSNHTIVTMETIEKSDGQSVRLDLKDKPQGLDQGLDEVDAGMMPRDDSMASVYFSTLDIQIEPTSDSKTAQNEDCSKRVNIAIQTDMSGAEIESKARERLRTLSSNSSAGKNSSSSPPRYPAFQSIPSSHAVESTSLPHKLPSRKNSQDTAANKTLLRLRSRDSEVSLASLASSKKSYASQASGETMTQKPDSGRDKKLTKRRAKVRVDAHHSKDSDSSNDSPVQVPEGGMFGIDDLEDEIAAECAAVRQDTSLECAATQGTSLECAATQGTSLGAIGGVDKQRLTEEWARSQFASSEHPWSEADITPIMSPMTSRPPSPKSDTEYEMRKFDSSSQTLITGTGEEISNMSDIRWEWGELPETVVTTPEQQQQSVAIKDAEHPPGGLFQFMRKTKKIRHQPEKEGIYLEDLNLEDMDPEVAQLYLYGNKHQSKLYAHTLDEDTESGRGASLPQSPVSMDLNHLSNGHSSSVFRPVARKGSLKLPEMYMSLCGGLTGSDVSEERFSQYLVTYDEFCQNPAIINDANLVIKISDKFYNWQTAAPVMMSYMCFNLPLPDKTVDGLIKQHRPKKESRKRGWFSWGRHQDDTSPANQIQENSQPISEASASDQPISITTPTSSPASSSPNSPQKLVNQQRTEEEPEDVPKQNGISEEDTTDQLGELENIDFSAKRSLHKSNSTSQFDRLTAPQKKYAKSLKLSSQEIEKLHLKEGHNTAAFSVTTQYQGTARCDAHIYLWNWNDKLIISDIDGTITRSDVLGHVLPLVGKDWSQVGITTLYNELAGNGYKFVYLSARAIGQSTMTRAYLRSVTQENNQKLPEGPLLLSPSSLVSAFHKEVIERKPQEFKIGCLKNIRALFPLTLNPFVAGFGNKINDVWAYQEVGVPIPRIFTVNHRGELRMETVNQFSSSYKKLSDIVDMFFPPLSSCDETDSCAGPRRFQAADYSSFTYWREPIPEIDLQELKSGGVPKKDAKK